MTAESNKRSAEQGCGEIVLVIEDAPDDAARISDELGSSDGERFEVELMAEPSGVIERLKLGGIGVVVLSLPLSNDIGLDLLDQIILVVPRVSVLVVSELKDEAVAMRAVQRGAKDYLLKDQADGYRLRRAIRTMMACRAAESVRVENESKNIILDSIGEAILRTDLSGKVMYLNRAAQIMTGWSREEALGRPLGDVFHIVDEFGQTAECRNAATSTLADRAAQTLMSNKNSILIKRDGTECGIESFTNPVLNLEGFLSGSILTFRDISAARATSSEMARLAQHDFLTGLPNRLLFNDRLEQAISQAERQGNQLGVMFVDLDHFKRINDSLGHAVGDKLLQSVSRRLLACVRRTDTVSRWSGDEFVVLLSQIQYPGDAAVSARKIIRALAAPHDIDGHLVDVSVSLGVSTFPEDGSTLASLLGKADTAMYEAKKRGRNTYEFFERNMHARLAERSSLESDLRFALGRREFFLHYQPQCNLKTGKITGVEALLRWERPNRGLVPPLEFVSVAEECGLIAPIGRWVLLEACKQSRRWSDEGLEVVPIAVNVSAAEFGAKDFLSGIRTALIATSVDPRNVELELTESVLMHDPEATIVTLKALKAMGIQLAIDDFGTGYSSFSYLRRFPADVLKLHQSFIQDISSAPSDTMIVSAMINIGKSLKQRVIAEGVETRDQLEFLRLHGCREGQGYYFSPPIPPLQAGKLFKTGPLRMVN
ncbi:MAG: EAL domain-containing protein [Candidatus Acidiferrum sp.]|jgi:diguanylate cyclase (GGDEF)-like protein/PAS domain S-box-containing protein